MEVAAANVKVEFVDFTSSLLLPQRVASAKAKLQRWAARRLVDASRSDDSRQNEAMGRSAFWMSFSPCGDVC